MSPSATRHGFTGVPALICPDNIVLIDLRWLILAPQQKRKLAETENPKYQFHSFVVRISYWQKPMSLHYIYRAGNAEKFLIDPALILPNQIGAIPGK